MKKCVICGRELAELARLYCSDKCAKRSYYLKHRKKIIKRVTEYGKKHPPKNREESLVRILHAQPFYRKKLLKSACEDCKSNKNLNLHHVTYERKNPETLTLCASCHKRYHAFTKELFTD